MSIWDIFCSKRLERPELIFVSVGEYDKLKIYFNENRTEFNDMRRWPWLGTPNLSKCLGDKAKKMLRKVRI